eukprot:6622379-Prymnesium_polylepis.1
MQATRRRRGRAAPHGTPASSTWRPRPRGSRRAIATAAPRHRQETQMWTGARRRAVAPRAGPPPAARAPRTGCSPPTR